MNTAPTTDTLPPAEHLSSVNIAPSNDGYESMLRMFIDSILRDVKVARRKDATAIMGSVLDITQYLSRVDLGRDRVGDVIRELERRS